jgi:hypothetical protein
LGSSQLSDICPKIGYQLFDGEKIISGLDALKMPMAAFAPLIVVPNFSKAGSTVEERILQPVGCGWDRGWNAPENHLHNSAVVIIDALMKRVARLSLRTHDGIINHMVFLVIIRPFRRRPAPSFAQSSLLRYNLTHGLSVGDYIQAAGRSAAGYCGIDGGIGGG